MITVAATSASELWIKTVRAILAHGERTAPRGLVTLEVVDAHLELTCPRRRIVAAPPTRVINAAFAAAETVWILSGLDTDWIYTYNRKLTEFTDGGVLQGAYGPRLRAWAGNVDQLDQVRRELRADPATRRAVIQLFDPARDHQGHKDVPCTLGHWFVVRDGQLDMHTTMRSQDLWLGFCYDIFTATVLHELLAGWIGADLGTYHHHVGSLHLYAEHVPRVHDLPSEVAPSPVMPPLATGWEGTDQLLETVISGRPCGHPGWQEITEVMRSYRVWKAGDRDNARAIAGRATGPLLAALTGWYDQLGPGRGRDGPDARRGAGMTATSPVVLGLCSGTHDSAAALIADGALAGLVEEERLNGDKHTKAYPERAIRWLLQHTGIKPGLVTHVVYNFDPLRYLAAAPAALPYLAHAATARRALPRVWSFAHVYRNGHDRLRRFGERFPNARVSAVEHHLTHGLYALATSGFADTAVLIVDSLGETATTRISRADASAGGGVAYRRVQTITDPASLGYAYGAVTQHLGWRRGDEEGTVMALAALGDPARFRPLMHHAIPTTETAFTLDLRLFPLRVLSRRWPRVSGAFIAETCPPRTPDAPVEQVHADLAAALQERTEQVMLHLARRARTLTGSRRLCAGGGVAMNCVAIGQLVEHAGFDEIAVPSAPADSGTAAGAALALHHRFTGRFPEGVSGACYLGPQFPDVYLPQHPRPGLTAVRVTCPACLVAQRLTDGKIIGLFQGRLEAGPRALGNRSILASPLDTAVVDRLNSTIKYREPFRPFAPVVLAEAATRYFTLRQPSPFMSIASGVTEQARQVIPVVVHVNGTARVQTVTADQNPFLAEVLAAFAAITGVPVLINTSLNIKGKPICGTPEAALDCLTESGLDALLLEGWWVSKAPPIGCGGNRAPAGVGVMRIGYSFWGFLGPGVTDTPDGGRSHRRTLIDGLAHRGHEVVFLQANRDLHEAGDDLREHYAWDGGMPAVDVLFLEWRWTIPGRNDTRCGSPGHTCDLHRQDELVRHYVLGRGLPTILWDKDLQLALQHPLRTVPHVTVCEAALYPGPGAVSLLFPVADTALDHADPNTLALLPRDLPLVYVGNQYDRDESFGKFFAPVAAFVPHLVAGKWPRTQRWPQVNFIDRIPFPQVAELHQRAVTTMLLAPDRLAANGQFTQRIFESVLAGCLPLAPAYLKAAEKVVPPELIVADAGQALAVIDTLTRSVARPAHAQLIRRCLAHLDRFRLSRQLDTVAALLDATMSPPTVRM